MAFPGNACDAGTPEECCVAARGTTTKTTSALQTATGTILLTPTTTSVFVVPDYFQMDSSAGMRHVQGPVARAGEVSAGAPCPAQPGEYKRVPLPLFLKLLERDACTSNLAKVWNLRKVIYTQVTSPHKSSGQPRCTKASKSGRSSPMRPLGPWPG